jgi:hypothetical protein
MALKLPPRPSPLANPAIRQFLDGLAVLIARRIGAGTQGKTVEDTPEAKTYAESGSADGCDLRPL